MKKVLTELTMNRRELRDFILTTAALTGILTGIFTLAAKATPMHDDNVRAMCSMDSLDR